MSDKLQTEHLISQNVLQALKKLADDGVISQSDIPDSVDVETPNREMNGEYSVNAAMKMAKAAQMDPRALAGKITEKLDSKNLHIDRVEIAGAGFINFFMKTQSLYDELPVILAKGTDYGSITLSRPMSVIVGYVSAGPAEPLPAGYARGGAVGDVLAAIYEKAGWQVAREIRLNDADSRMARFAESLNHRFLQHHDPDMPFQEDLNQGEDISELAFSWAGDNPGAEKLSDSIRKEKLVAYALSQNAASMREALENCGIHYDTWFAESSLYESGAVSEIIEIFKEHGAAYEQAGALWFKATDFDCRKDEILRRSDGIPAHFAADAAYHYDKLVKRGYDLAVNIRGDVQHGHVHTMRTALKAVGIEPGRLKTLLIEPARLTGGEEYLSLSKRKGRDITLSGFIGAVGADAARFFFNAFHADARMDFDMDKAIAQNNENPVFYVQMTYARMRSIQRNVSVVNGISASYTLLTDRTEIALLKKLTEFSREIVQAAKDFDTARMTRYAYDIATLFHNFYNACRMKSSDDALTASRLDLVGASAIVLGNTLKIIGISAPESM